jgi:hypothetical protein
VSMVCYGRFADAPPPERELLAVAEDGAATAWRSIAPVGGRFAGSVPDIGALCALVDAAIAAGPPSPLRVAPDAVIEEVEAGGVSVTLPLDQAPAGPWSDLAAACRTALEAVSSSLGAAVAAVGAAVEADGRLRLRHPARMRLPGAAHRRAGLDAGHGDALG